MILASLISVQAQTPYKKRILIYGPTLHNVSPPSYEDGFINSHPDEFEPVQTGTSGKSAIWDEQQWVNATVADFQQFDAICFSDRATDTPAWAAALATRAIWGSAVNGNIFVTSGDPLSDAFSPGPGNSPLSVRVFRQGLRFAGAQAGNAHGRTGLYVALDHSLHGEDLGGLANATEIPILSWFGSFRAVRLLDASPTRLIAQNPFLNVLGADVVGYSGSTAQGFHSWPNGFIAIAVRMTDPFPTPNSTPFYVPCEADTGYEYKPAGLGGLCAARRPLAYMLAKPANPADVTLLVAAECNKALNVGVGQRCNFTAWSSLGPLPYPSGQDGPATQVSWRVVSGPNVDRHGKCTRQQNGPGGPYLNYWNGYYDFAGPVNPNNSQDIVKLFLDYNGDEDFNDMSNSASLTDPDDPRPGMTIEYGTTFTVNWGAPQLSVTKLATPAAAAEPATSAFFRVSRTGSVASQLGFSACLSGTASSPCAGWSAPDYEVRVSGNLIQVAANCGFTAIIPATAGYLDVEIRPVDDTEAEGPETVRISLEDAVSAGSYVVGGNGFAELTINDNDQPVVTVTKTVDASENEPITSGAWSIQTAAAIASNLKVYFKLSGTANNEVDYFTSLVSAADDYDLINDNIILPSGTCRVTLRPNTGPANTAQTSVTLTPFQDSRTEGTESAIATLLTHPSYKLGSPASASVNITDNDTPQLPANGYSITDLGDANHAQTTAVGINNNAPPQVAGTAAFGADLFRAFRYSAGVFTDIPPTSDFQIANGINDGGWMVGTAYSMSLPGAYYWRWNGSATIQLQAPNPGAVETTFGPRAINDANWIVGAAKNQAAAVYRATRWDAAGNYADLGGLSSIQSFSAYAWAISSSATGHRVVGESQFDLPSGVNATTAAFHAFRTKPGTITPRPVAFDTDDLGNALASETSSSAALAVNSLFEIAGVSSSSGTLVRAAYKDGNSRKHLGWRTFGGGLLTTVITSKAYGINDVGLIVGYVAYSGGASKAVVWENYQTPSATDLNLKIPAADQPNWLLQVATGINNSGSIVGYGLKNGQQRAFLLTPIPWH